MSVPPSSSSDAGSGTATGEGNVTLEVVSVGTESNLPIINIQNESPGPIKKLFIRVSDRYPSVFNWKRPWKNPLIMFPITFILTTINAIELFRLCTAGVGIAEWEYCELPKQRGTDSCTSNRCTNIPPYSFWLSQPVFYASANELPCSLVRQAALDLSSSFPDASYVYAVNNSFKNSIFTISVCTNASLQQLDTVFMNSLKNSVPFRNALFFSQAQVFQRKMPILELFPWMTTEDSSYYAPCCTDKYCVDQLKTSSPMQPYKFVWGSIPAITSSTSSKKCQDLFGCNGGLAMIPIPGTSICNQNVYVVQAEVGVAFLFRFLFMFALAFDLALLLTLAVNAISSIRLYRIRTSLTAESIQKRFPGFSIDFFNELHSTGKVDQFVCCMRDLRIQMFMDQAVLNVYTVAFAEFYLLLNSISELSPDAAIAYIALLKSTAYGNLDENFEVDTPLGKQQIPKHWKKHGDTMRALPIRFIFCLGIQALINIAYPVLSVSSLASCPSLLQTFQYLVIVKAVVSIFLNFVTAFKGTCCVSSKVE